MKVFDIFYKRGKNAKTEYAGSLWEGRYADEQKEKGNEPWLDVNLSRVIEGERVYATSIIYGGKYELKLGKEANVFLKAGIVEGLTITQKEVGDGVVSLEDADEDEPSVDGGEPLDLTELE